MDIDILLLPGEWVATLLAIPPHTLKYWLVLWGINAPVNLFVARTVLTVTGRMCGFYHPNHYRLWPRLPWRSLVKLYVTIQVWYERVFVMGKRASGGFSGVRYTLSLLYCPGKILLGRAYAFGVGLLQPVGVKVSAHLFMYAMTGAGKTTALITIINAWNNSAFIIDPKSQILNALSIHDWRKWFAIEPYGNASACYNVFDCIKAAMKRDGNQAAVRWSIRVANALIITPAGSRSPFFTDTARGFIMGVILHVLIIHSENEHNLPFVRDLIVNGYRVIGDDGEELNEDEAHELLLRTMVKNPAFEGAIAGAAAAMASASGETAGNVRATLQEQMKWLDIPEVRSILRKTSLPLSDLKTRNDVVLVLAAPVFSIREELAPLSRLLTNMIAYTFEAVKKKNGQCLNVIDELASQGYNETLEVAFPVGRSYGQIFLGIAQNIELMRKTYPNSWGIFSGEADYTFWLATNHNETAAHLSKILGKKSYVEKDRYSRRKSYREVEVMDADQVKRFLSPDSNNLIVTRAGGRALKLKNEPYFRALPVWCYAADPDHREALLRRIFRFLFDRKGRAAKRAAHQQSKQVPETIEPIPEEEPVCEPVWPENVIPFPNQHKKEEKEHEKFSHK